MPALTARPFSTVLVANRGEIAVRIFRTLRAKGMGSVAVHAPDDSGGLHVRCADVAVPIAGYLDVDAVVAAATSTGAEAVHPGYGFLSERAELARAVLGADLVWIGPPPEVIETMGDKIRARDLVAAAGVPVVPGAGAPGMTDAEVAAAAEAVGLPVLLKPAAGGGGKGMRLVTERSELAGAIAAARREASGAFGDDTLLVERWVRRARHIEIQVFADAYGDVVHLGERECSLQRRHQKIVEESPSPLLDEVARQAMAESALAAARACGYVGAGTVELIVPADRPGEHYFMEMNTRLQVEHPVTEMVTGVDLVDWQLRVAAGEPLPLAQPAIVRRGHAVEARVYAEDVRRGFLPASGTVLALEQPDGRPGVRVDSALYEGLEVGTRYDPMLAKVIAWGEDRREAVARLRGALAATTVLGVTTNLDHLVGLLAHPDVVAGEVDTELVERTVHEVLLREPTDAAAAAVAACLLAAGLEPTGPVVDPWDIPDGWRPGSLPREASFELVHDGRRVDVAVRGRVTRGATVAVGGGAPVPLTAMVKGREVVVSGPGTTTRWRAAVSGDDVWVGYGGRAWRWRAVGPERTSGGHGEGAAGPVRSPMPGVVVALHAAVGARVRAGQALVGVEAMKMEHTVVAPADGVVEELLVRVGQAVALDEPLAAVTATHGDGPGDGPGDGGDGG